MHSPWEGNYDLILGTSERGTPVKKMQPQKAKHIMVVFGGVKGLEYSFDQDPELKENGIESVTDLFDMVSVLGWCRNLSQGHEKGTPPRRFILKLVQNSDSGYFTARRAQALGVLSDC